MQMIIYRGRGQPGFCEAQCCSGHVQGALEVMRGSVFPLNVHRALRPWPVRQAGSWSSRPGQVTSVFQLFATETSSKNPPFSHTINFPF